MALQVCKCDDIPVNQANYWIYWNPSIKSLKLAVQGLIHVGQRGNTLPSIGHTCLIMKGKSGVDEGQMGVIKAHTVVMVEVVFKDKNGKETSKLERPSSLMIIEQGIIIHQDMKGTVAMDTKRHKNRIQTNHNGEHNRQLIEYNVLAK
jgi:hypothetical protein